MESSPIIPWLGGKRRLAGRLIPLFPPMRAMSKCFPLVQHPSFIANQTARSASDSHANLSEADKEAERVRGTAILQYSI